MGNYERDKQKAMSDSDNIINKVLFEQEGEVDLAKLELHFAPLYQCSFMKVFLKRVELNQLAHPKIIYDKENNLVRWATDVEVVKENAKRKTERTDYERIIRTDK